MTQKEQYQIKKAIKYLLDENGFQKGTDILINLVGDKTLEEELGKTEPKTLREILTDG